MSWQTRGDESTPIFVPDEQAPATAGPAPDNFRGAPGALQYDGGAVPAGAVFANTYFGEPGQKTGFGSGVGGPPAGSYYFPSMAAAQAVFPSYGKITDSGGGFGGFVDALKNDFAPGGVPLALAALGGGAMGGGLGAALSGATGGGAAEVSALSSGLDAGASAGESLMPPAVLDTGGAAMMPAAMPAADATFGGALAETTSPGVFAVPGSSTSAPGAAGGGEIDGGAPPAGGTAMLNASSPLTTIDASTAAALGITPDPEVGARLDGLSSSISTMGFDTSTGMVSGGAPTFGDASGDTGFAGGGTSSDGGTSTGMSDVGGEDVLDKGAALLKKLGLSPATAAMLGISGFQAFSKPKIPDAANKLQAGASPAADQANSVIQSGGTSSPAFATQKASIDATIDQQIKEQSEAMLQQAVNSGQGADSQLTLQQINKLKTQLETQRQTLYAQAAQQNVSAALQQLGISDQALAQVANAQFASDNQAKTSASETAKMALMLQSLSKQPA